MQDPINKTYRIPKVLLIFFKIIDNNTRFKNNLAMFYDNIKLNIKDNQSKYTSFMIYDTVKNQNQYI